MQRACAVTRSTPIRVADRSVQMLIALGASSAGMGARGLLDPWLGDAVPFAFALPAVFFVGWLAGTWMAALAAALSVAWLLIPGIPPTIAPGLAWRTILYFLPSALLLGFFASRWRAAINRGAAPASLERRGGMAWLWAAIVLGGAVPLAIFAAAAVSLYSQALAEASLRVERAARICEEHALKIFETDIALVNRILDALGDEAEDTLLAREAALHEQLKRMSVNLPQLQGIFVIGGSGRMIVNNRIFPALHNVDFSDRPAFVHHRQGGPQPYISELLTSRTTGEPFVDLSVRRSLSDGGFGGTVSASMSPAYFAAFYREIADNAAGLSISMQRADGAVLTGWPQMPSAADAARPASAAATAPAPVATGRPSGSAPSSIRRVGGYPVFVTVRMERSAVLAPWYNQMILMLALTFPAVSGLMYIGWIALQRTRDALHTAEALRRETLARKQVEDSLRQSQKMEAVGQLTGGIAHDFNNLLQVISANLHLIGKGLSGNAAVANRLTHAQEAVKRGASLASQLLAFGRRQPLEPRVVNIGKLVLGLEDMLRRSIGEAIELEAIVSGGLWNTEVDPGQIENAILNLAINARDAMQDSGKLTIELANASLDEAYTAQHADVLPGQYVLLAVSDTGMGMSPEVAAHAFEPFFSTKAPGAGTGLGLSMVYGFVKQSGGHVKIYSEPGLGTTIKLYLPRCRRNEDAEIAKNADAPARGAETILVVEDDAAVRTATVDMLAALGYRVLTVADADSAMALITGGADVDLLFTDVVMPGTMRAPDLVRHARDALPDIAVLYTSGYAQNAIVHGGRLDAGVELLPKPYTADVLASRVRAVLNDRAQQTRQKAPEEKPVTPPNPAAHAAAPMVLLVEDDELIRSSTAEMVRDLGYPVVETSNAEDAVELLFKHDIGVLMADIGLPGMSGDVFAAQVRSIRPTLAIIFATGNDRVRSDPADEGGVVLLRKPYGPAAIEAALHKVQARPAG